MFDARFSSKRIGRTLVLFAEVLGVLITAPSVRAQTESVLYSFTGGADGGNTYARLVGDSKGNFYGTTLNGGYGYGTVFVVSPTGTETALYSFKGGGRRS